MTPEAALAQVLKEVRSASGLTQENLADRLSCSRGYINYIENGAYNPTVSFLFRLSAALGVSAGSIISRAEELADEPSQQVTRPRQHSKRKQKERP